MEGKKRKYSKKKKRNWRKHTDVKDVEEYLEDKRRQEVTGVPAAEKEDNQLFFLQREAEESFSEGIKPRKRKPLKSEAALQPNPAIVGFPSRKRKRTDMKSKHGAVGVDKDPKEVDSSSEDEEYDKSVAFSQIKKQREKALSSLRKQRPVKASIQTTARDLWNDEDTVKTDIPDDHYLKVTRKKPVKRPNSMKGKPSAIKNIEIPHPGMSYNPTFEDHQDLLQAAVGVEEQKQLATEKLEKKLQLSELSHQQREQVWLDEMTEGILDKDEKGEEHFEEEEGDGELPPLKRPVRAGDKKPRRQRRKERERKEEEYQKESEKAQKMQMNEVYRLRSIKKEIEGKEQTVSEKQQKRLEMEAQSPYQTKRLGKQLYEEPDIDIQLSTEITGSLRNLKPEGNLAVDRFKSLQKRNILEPRERVKPYRKYKLQVKEKRSARLQK